jgi:hypothetical protein
MDEQSAIAQSQNSTPNADDAQGAVSQAGSNQSNNITGDNTLPNPQGTSGPSLEDSGEPETKKAEAAADHEWQKQLKTFESKINGLLAAQENLKLVAVDQNLHSAYVEDWKLQSNRYFQLVVALRRRIRSGTVGGKQVA